MKLLKELYTTFSPSGKEGAIADLIKIELQKMQIIYNEDFAGNIFHIVEERGMFCAHMDQVQHEACTEVVLHKGHLHGIAKNPDRLVGLGADDKNGIWITLKVLEWCKQKGHLLPGFLFTTQEESGGKGGRSFCDAHKEELMKAQYALIFDRRNGGDIVGVNNGYCEHDFQKEVEKIGKKFGYKPNTGTFSDCDALSKHLACVNLSCGYYEAHTVKENTSIEEIRKALSFAKSLLLELPDKRFKVSETSIFERESSWSWGKYQEDEDWGWDGRKWKHYVPHKEVKTNAVVSNILSPRSTALAMLRKAKVQSLDSPGTECPYCSSVIEIETLVELTKDKNHHVICPYCAEWLEEDMDEMLELGTFFETIQCPFCLEPTYADQNICCQCSELLYQEQ